VAAFVAGRAVLPHDRGYAESRLDPISGALVTGGLMAVVLGCAQAASHGWASTQVLVPGVAGIVLIAAFLVRQGRMSQPLLPLWLLRDHNRAGAYTAVAVSVVGSFGMFLMLTYHFQVVLGWTPVHAGMAFLPLSAAVSASAYGLGSRLLPRLAPRALIAPGLAIAAAGLFLLTTLTPSSDYVTVILPAEVLLGVGMGLVFTPAISVVTSGVEPRYAGVAAATANTAMQIGSSVGTAVLNSVAVAATASYVVAHRPGDTRDALVHGYATATGWSALTLALVAVLVVVLVRTPRPQPHLHMKEN
jgi:Major Facilitator Superfamily